MMDQLITQAVEAAYHFGFPLDAGAVLIIELDGLAAGLERQAAAGHRNLPEESARAKCAWPRRPGTRRSLEMPQARLRRHRPAEPELSSLRTVSCRARSCRRSCGSSARCSDKYGLRIPNVFHAGDGNIHPLVLYDERDPDQVRRALAAGDEILAKCIELGGSVTGEHGIGVEKIDFMARQFTPDDLEAMRMLRRVFDPEGRCNPHKMFPGSKRCADFAPRKQIGATADTHPWGRNSFN